MTYSANGTARLMLLAAQRLDENPDTGRRAAELALPATNTSDVHVASSGTSDPTPMQALSEQPAIATYEARWRLATNALQGWVGSPLPSALRASEPLVRSGAYPWANGYLINKIGGHCDEVIRLIDLCRPMDLKAADEMLRESAKLALSSDCRACGAPIDKPENRKLGKYDQWCYKRIPQWMRANPGKAIDDHHPEFCAWIRHNISIRMVGFERPASIHYPIGRMTIPEGA